MEVGLVCENNGSRTHENNSNSCLRVLYTWFFNTFGSFDKFMFWMPLKLIRASLQHMHMLSVYKALTIQKMVGSNFGNKIAGVQKMQKCCHNMLGVSTLCGKRFGTLFCQLHVCHFKPNLKPCFYLNISIIQTIIFCVEVFE